VRFWDSSAIVPLLVEEEASAKVVAWYEEDADTVAWWGTPVECMSALARLERQSRIGADGMANALKRLEALELQWHEVQPVAPVRESAQRMLRVHPLRAMDALQLGAALVAAEHRPRTLAFVCLDARLSLAAQKEGFPVISA